MNMSGQRNLNPFAATSWTPSASSTASKTVADAQAERRQRQQERDKLKAAESIQRTWRGHRVRRNLKDDRRHVLDNLYSHDKHLDSESKVSEALPLVVSVLDPRRPDDRTRLERFSVDLDHYRSGIIGTVVPSHIQRLAEQLILLLEWYVVPFLPSRNSGELTSIIQLTVQTPTKCRKQYYDRSSPSTTQDLNLFKAHSILSTRPSENIVKKGLKLTLKALDCWSRLCWLR